MLLAHLNQFQKLTMDKIPNQVGYLILNEEGAVISSAGELENDERTAEVIMGLVTLTSQIDPFAFPNTEGFKKLSITYDDHCYIVCLSNRKIHIVKKIISPSATGSAPDVVTVNA